MEEDQKKRVMVVVIVVCLVGAAGLTLMQMDSDEAEIPEFEGEIVWVLCRNPDCQGSYKMSKNAYFVYLKENDDPRSMGAPALLCQECSKESGFRAEKCEKCAEVFEPGSIYQIHGDVSDYPDRCPKCRYSKREEDRGVKYKPKR
jgi:hypothetical protein